MLMLTACTMVCNRTKLCVPAAPGLRALVPALSFCSFPLRSSVFPVCSSVFPFAAPPTNHEQFHGDFMKPQTMNLQKIL